MPRHPIKKKRTVFPDPIYNSVTVHMLVNRVMKSGKKSLAYKIVYNTLKNYWTNKLAALAVLLGQHTWATLQGASGSVNFTQVGLLGAVFFLTAVVGAAMAHRTCERGTGRPPRHRPGQAVPAQRLDHPPDADRRGGLGCRWPGAHHEPSRSGHARGRWRCRGQRTRGMFRDTCTGNGWRGASTGSSMASFTGAVVVDKVWWFRTSPN